MKTLIGCAACASLIACMQPGTLSSPEDYADAATSIEGNGDGDRAQGDGDGDGDAQGDGDGDRPQGDGDGDGDAQGDGDGDRPRGDGDGGAGDGDGIGVIKCDEPFQDGELHGCITTISPKGQGTGPDIKVKFFPLQEGHTVDRLAVFLHGDTGQDWTENYGFWDIVPWALSHDVLVMGPLSPVAYDDDPPDMPSYGAAGPGVAAPVADAIEAFARSFDTRTDNLLAWTSSGGSWFLTSSFLPLMGARLQGLFAVSCGASDWFEDYDWDYQATSPRDQIKLFFNYGSEDFLLDGEERSVAKYKMDGFDVTSMVHPGSMHCEHPIEAPTIKFWEANL